MDIIHSYFANEYIKTEIKDVGPLDHKETLYKHQFAFKVPGLYFGFNVKQKDTTVFIKILEKQLLAFEDNPEFWLPFKRFVELCIFNNITIVDMSTPWFGWYLDSRKEPLGPGVFAVQCVSYKDDPKLIAACVSNLKIDFVEVTHVQAEQSYPKYKCPESSLLSVSFPFPFHPAWVYTFQICGKRQGSNKYLGYKFLNKSIDKAWAKDNSKINVIYSIGVGVTKDVLITKRSKSIIRPTPETFSLEGAESIKNKYVGTMSLYTPCKFVTITDLPNEDPMYSITLNKLVYITKINSEPISPILVVLPNHTAVKFIPYEGVWAKKNIIYKKKMHVVFTSGAATSFAPEPGKTGLSVLGNYSPSPGLYSVSPETTI